MNEIIATSVGSGAAEVVWNWHLLDGYANFRYSHQKKKPNGIGQWGGGIPGKFGNSDNGISNMV